MLVLSFLLSLLGLFKIILLIRIVLSWLPSIRWYDAPWSYLDAITEPILAPARRLIPPIGMMDISPLVVFFLIYLLEGLIRSAIIGGMG
ncbi:MAG: YggT family protein [Vampirovibrio sp.]|nr:YggT family protein [Vampirovibrio sp.]